MGKSRHQIMEHDFSNVPAVQAPRSRFNRSQSLKTTFDGGRLVPVFCDEVVPGDTFNLSMDALARLATPIAPLMHDIYLDSFFFFVPCRLLWENWEKFMGAQDNPTDSIDYLIPMVNSDPAGYGNQSIFDYFGLPTKVATSYQHSALPLRAYQLIWNEWFRSQDLQNSYVEKTGDGPDSYTLYSSIQRRGKRHDYFTAALPFPQKGEDVTIGIGGTAPLSYGEETVVSTGMPTWSLDGNVRNLRNQTDVTNTYWSSPVVGQHEALWANPNLKVSLTGGTADLSSASPITINELREAVQTQKFLEKCARGGTRYIEILKAHFGVTSPDARLQRPEYLGGGSTPLGVTPVPQTSSTDGTSPKGDLSAYSQAFLSNHGFIKSFTEHGYIIGLVSARADLVYQHGLHRMWSREDRLDFYWPSFAHLGEQPILNKEIYLDGSANDDDAFGYIPRYDEMRYGMSRVTGLFRSNDTNSLDFWHLALDYTGAPPSLNSTFIQDDPPIDRVIAAPSEPHFIMDAHFDLVCTRPMPTDAVPGRMDHL